MSNTLIISTNKKMQTDVIYSFRAEEFDEKVFIRELKNSEIIKKLNDYPALQYQYELICYPLEYQKTNDTLPIEIKKIYDKISLWLVDVINELKKGGNEIKIIYLNYGNDLLEKRIIEKKINAKRLLSTSFVLELYTVYNID